MSLPSRERGLKSFDIVDMIRGLRSLPSRERGLKSLLYPFFIFSLMSLPSRERGLKLLNEDTGDTLDAVAPFAGAWIEM